MTKTRIDDFGEHIPNAAKHRYHTSKWVSSVESSVANPKGSTLAQIWPAPKWQTLLDEGGNSRGIAAARSLRDLCPAPPKPWLPAKVVDRWNTTVRTLAKLSTLMIVDGVDAHAAQIGRAIDDLVQDSYHWYGGQVHIKQWRQHSQLYYHGGHKWSFSKVRLARKLGENTSQLLTEDLTENDLGVFLKYGKYSRTVDDRAFPTIEDAAEAWTGGLASNVTRTRTRTSAWRKKVGFYRPHGIYKSWFMAKKAPGSDLVPMFFFKSRKDMFNFWDKHNDLVALKVDSLEDYPKHRLGTGTERVGPQHREAEVTQQDIEREFGPRGVQFGNSMPQKERGQHMSQFHDALHDLSTVTGIPANELMLNNKLALAFGARGHGGKNPAAAHYEPNQRVINLTRANGAGTLAHEWWHAFDHNFGDGGMATENSVRDDSAERWNGAFCDLVTTMHLLPYARRCERMNAQNPRTGRLKTYWKSNVEMSARAFEAVVHERLAAAGIDNQYLVQITSHEAWLGKEASSQPEAPNGDVEIQGATSSYPYPTRDEVQVLDKVFTQAIEATLGVEPPSIEQLTELAANHQKENSPVEREPRNAPNMKREKAARPVHEPLVIGEYSGQGDMVALMGHGR